MVLDAGYDPALPEYKTGVLPNELIQHNSVPGGARIHKIVVPKTTASANCATGTWQASRLRLSIVYLRVKVSFINKRHVPSIPIVFSGHCHFWVR